jgi:DNA-binding beta-propeller fold protein YncE
MRTKLAAAMLAAAGCVAVFAVWGAVAEQGSPAPLRRPVAAAFLADGRTLCVANQRSGSVTLVDVSRSRLLGEWAVGRHLTDLAVLPDRKHILVVDDERQELIALACDGSRLTPRVRLTVGPYPVSVVIEPDGTRAAVVSLWSRRVEVVDLTPLAAASGPVTLRVLHTIRLPFAPRTALRLPGGAQMVVADAFGGHLAVVDLAAGRLSAVHELTGHNLRGLALSADGTQVLMAHQILDQKAPTTRENIVRGVLMNNVLRALPLNRLTRPQADLQGAGRVIRLGAIGAGAGDPAGLAVLPDGQVAVALAGVHQVALLSADGTRARRIAVGRRPTALVAPGPEQTLVAVNTFDDSLSVLDPRRGVVLRTIALGPQGTLSYKDEGENLFYDARLSPDGWLSCNSCHPDGHTNGLLADTFGDGSFGTPKRTLTLMNTRLTDPWGWTGRFRSLSDQVKASVEGTLHSPAAGWRQVQDLVSFLDSLPPPPPPEPVPADAADRQRVARGRRVFAEHGCGNCHVGPQTYTSWEVFDVGFADERGNRKFNPPSLRGVGQGDHFLHDNRAATLEEVFTKFRHKTGADASPADIADLARFLRSL